jgi:hypothetical protein
MAPRIEEIPSFANSCFQKRTSSAMLQVKVLQPRTSVVCRRKEGGRREEGERRERGTRERGRR